MDAGAIIALVSLVIVIVGAVAGAAWTIARAVFGSEARTARNISDGLAAVYDHIDKKFSEKSEESLTRHRTVVTRIEGFESAVGELNDRVGVIEKAVSSP